MRGSVSLKRKRTPTVRDLVGSKGLNNICLQLVRRGIRGPHLKLRRLLASSLSRNAKFKEWQSYLSKLARGGRLPPELETAGIKNQEKKGEGAMDTAVCA